MRLHPVTALKKISLRDLLAIIVPSVILLAIALSYTARFIRPAPPNHFVLSSGATGGAYESFALRYRDVLTRYGVDLQLQPSAGAMENLQRLQAGDVDAAFLQGGVVTAKDDDSGEIVSLGTLYPEPLWIFYRAGLSQQPLTRLTDLHGKRIAIGAPGSGTRELALTLLQANGVNAHNSVLVPEGGLDLARRLQWGQIDAVFVVGTAYSASVWQLLYTRGVQLMNLSEAEAYTHHFSYLSHLVLPAGGIDFIRHMPATDVHLVAPPATLLVKRNLHPALIDLLLEAAIEIHGESGIFQRPHEYPKATGVDFPLAPEADRYYKSGKPFLQRYLPFWAATLIDRLMVMLIPLIAVLVPLFRFAPGLYTWRVRSRIYRRYGELKFLEAELDRDPNSRSVEEWMRRLDDIEREVNHLPTPLAFADMLYTMRTHIALVRGIVLSKTKGGETIVPRAGGIPVVERIADPQIKP